MIIVHIVSGGKTMAKAQVDIARNVEAIELLKVDLSSYLSDIYRALFEGDPDGVLDASANITIACYVLTKRLGLNFGHLERKIYNNIETILKEKNSLEICHGDVSGLKDYIDLKR
jgi:hypothetical protein